MTQPSSTKNAGPRENTGFAMAVAATVFFPVRLRHVAERRLAASSEIHLQFELRPIHAGPERVLLSLLSFVDAGGRPDGQAGLSEIHGGGLGGDGVWRVAVLPGRGFPFLRRIPLGHFRAGGRRDHAAGLGQSLCNAARPPCRGIQPPEPGAGVQLGGPDAGALPGWPAVPFRPRRHRGDERGTEAHGRASRQIALPRDSRHPAGSGGGALAAQAQPAGVAGQRAPGPRGKRLETQAPGAGGGRDLRLCGRGDLRYLAVRQLPDPT